MVAMKKGWRTPESAAKIKQVKRATKKPTVASRGFNMLKGEAVKSVNARAINEVIIKTEDGMEFAIIGEIGPLGIPTLSVENRTKEKPAVGSIVGWPYESK